MDLPLDPGHDTNTVKEQLFDSLGDNTVPLPLISYAPSSQNQRVEGYEVPGAVQARMYSAADTLPSASEMDAIIWAAYRQIFSEHQMIESNRERFLESQLRYGQITVRDFIRGLVLSDSFRRLNYETNSNYRFVEICVQRVLGRDVYSEQEKIAWSIVIATQGIQGFIDQLLNSDEYLETFGYDNVPVQRRRVLPQRREGEVPFNLKTPRYDAYHRDQLGFPQFIWRNTVRRFQPQELQPKAGDPNLYRDLAQKVNARPVDRQQVSVFDLSLDQVPYRQAS